MKKILSVLLALLMILSSASILASATELGIDADKTDEVKVSGTSGLVFYSQDFDGAELKNEAGEYLTGEALFEALGWEFSENVQLTVTEDGKLNIKATGEYLTTLVQDSKMNGNAITIQYDFTYATEAADSSYLSFNVCAEDAADAKTLNKNYVRATPVTALGTINENALVFLNGSPQTGLFKNLTLAVTKTTKDENDKDVTVITEAACEAPFENFKGEKHTMKCIIDPNSDGVIVEVDGKPMTSLLYEKRATWNQYGAGAENSINRVVGDILKLNVTAGADITIDNICVSEYAPALQISEIMANAKVAGEYQWLEIYNPTNVAANLYDYCVVIFNGCAGDGGKMGEIGSEIDTPKYNTDGSVMTETVITETADGRLIEVTRPVYNAWDTDAASTIGYFTPGEKQMTVNFKSENPEERYQTFVSPDYEDGYIAPGETAIVLIPNTAISGNRSIDKDAFFKYLQMVEPDLSDDYKDRLFICDNDYSRCGCDAAVPCRREMKGLDTEDPSDDVLETWEEACPTPYKYPFRIMDETNESLMVGLMRVENQAPKTTELTEEFVYNPVAIGLGRPNKYQFAYLESYAALTSKPAASASNILGFTTRYETQVVENKYPEGTVIYKYDQYGKPVPMRDENGNIIRDKNDEIIFDYYIPESVTKTQYVFSGHYGTSAGAFTQKGDKSFEICYNRYGNESCAQRMGRMEYNSNQPRPTLGTLDKYASPGFVPPNCRNAITVSVSNNINDSTIEMIARVGSDFSYKEAAPEGYEYLGMVVTVNGKVDEASAETPVDKVLGDVIKADSDISIVLTYRCLMPKLVGYQVSTPVDGVYTIRVIGKTSNLMCQSLGFRIQMTWFDKDLGEQSVEYDRECFYVYDSIKAGDTEYKAEDGEKFYAYHINNIPTNVKNLTLTVTPYYVKGLADTTHYLTVDSMATYLINEGNEFYEGEYEKHQDGVDFDYDKSRVPSPDLY